MRVICAWCQGEGRPAHLGEREPLSDLSETHGICVEHQRRLLLAEMGGAGRPEVELLLVVRPSERDLYDHLLRSVAQVKGVQVIVERRRGERRHHRRTVAVERRVSERRRLAGEFSLLGYTLVRLSSPRHIHA